MSPRGQGGGPTRSGRFWRTCRALPVFSWLLLGVPFILVAGTLAWVVVVRGPALSREETLEYAAGDERLVLGKSLDYAWEYVAEQVTATDSAATEERWRRYLAPNVPPPLCQLDTLPVDSEVSRLAQALARITPVGRDSILDLRKRFQPDLDSLQRLRAVGLGDRFLRAYSLARAEILLGDPSSATGEVPVLTATASEALPLIPSRGERRAAIERYRRGEVADWQVALSFFAHYTAALALHRADTDRDEAIREFRRAVNPLIHRLEPDEAETGQARRVEVPQRDFECTPPGGDAPAEKQFTSLDAYVGLVSAYWAHTTFRDKPGELADELVRRSGEAHHDPALSALLEHGNRQTNGTSRPGAPVVPENVLWAASNLSEVHLLNLDHRDQRIEASRAVVVLAAIRRWPGAVGAAGTREACLHRAAVLEDLRNPGNPAWSRDSASAVDSLLATVALEVRAAQHLNSCASPGDVEERQVRSAMLRFSGNYVADGVASRFEQLRTRLEKELRQRDRNLQPLVYEAELAAHSVDVDSGRARRKRARKFIAGWWRAVFADVAPSLGASLAERSADASGHDAARALDAVHSATVYAGLRPRQMYPYQEFRPLARRAGLVPRLVYEVRYRTFAPRVQDVLLMLGIGVLGVCVLALGVWSSLLWWRFRLVTGSQFRKEQSRQLARWRRRRSQRDPRYVRPPDLPPSGEPT